MTTARKQKRLDPVEVALTPKEWATRLADEMVRQPSGNAFMEHLAKGTYRNSPTQKPYFALAEQAENKYPGPAPEDVRAKIKLGRALLKEYHGLKQLIFDVNRAADAEGRVCALRAALNLTALQSVVLQDAFGRTARKAVEWIEEYKPADADEEEARQGMLKELATYTDVDFGEKWSDSLPISPDVRIRFPSVIEDWVSGVVALSADVFAYRAAVGMIQDKHFDGHPILFRDVEAGLDEAIKILEVSIASFNDYLKTRSKLFKEEWDIEEESEDGITSAIPGEREGKLVIDTAAIRASRIVKNEAKRIADGWIKNARDKATLDYIEDPGEEETFIWNQLRAWSGEQP